MQGVLENNKAKQFENLVVEMILSIRNAYVASRKGKVKPDYWDRIQDMIRVGSRTTTTISELVTSAQGDLQIQGLDKYGCQALIELVNWVDENWTQIDAIDFIDCNTPMLIALARKTVDVRKTESAKLEADRKTAATVLGSDSRNSSDEQLGAAREFGVTTEEFERAAKENGLWSEDGVEV